MRARARGGQARRGMAVAVAAAAAPATPAPPTARPPAPNPCLAGPQAMFELSAPGSRVVMTAPPNPRVRAESAANGMTLHHQVFEEPEDTLAR
jgi:hypothetical protein